jgi:hypothetical protein
MRKHLAVVGAVTMAVAAAAPADARLADPVVGGTQTASTFSPGLSDAAQSGYKPHPAAPATDLRGEAARAAAEPAADLRGEAARAAAEPATPAGEGARAAAEPATPRGAAPVAVSAPAAADDGLDWASVGLGAGGGIVLAAMTAGGVVLATRRGVRLGASR